MSEVVGLAASIIQIGGAGTKLFVGICNHISTAARMDSEIANIVVDVENALKVLDGAGILLVSEDAKRLINQDAVQHTKDLMEY